MRKLFVLYLCLISAVAYAQNYDKHFRDTTLRMDYILTGNAASQQIALDRLSKMPGWYGRKHHMESLPVEGNAQLTVKDHYTGDTIYRNSASTLFQEWLTYPEAQGAARSFEQVWLMPMPKDIVDVTIELRDNRRKVTASYNHTVNPQDILIRRIGERDITPYEVLQKAEDDAKRINIAFVAEGYTESEMDIFIRHANEAVEAIFAHEPFKSLRNRFNIIAVKAPSAESGTSEPGNGVWKNTALGSHFDTFYSDRYLTTLQLKAIHDRLAGTPYEHIIVLVNTEKYGGGGILNNYTLTMTRHTYFKEVVTHEFGHSFAGLADEYAYPNDELDMYPLDIEPWEPNITTKVNFASKWQDMPQVGLYEGAGYRTKGIFRPTKDCRMRSNTTPDFCPVCQRAIRQLVEFVTE
ncbi:MAG: peptidase M64 [Prevotella sp.]|nr:peptidase M64 [Prevotella sp.]MCF0192801.1 peptidase M64 [Prevotella sp.]